MTHKRTTTMHGRDAQELDRLAAQRAAARGRQTGRDLAQGRDRGVGAGRAAGPDRIDARTGAAVTGNLALRHESAVTEPATEPTSRPRLRIAPPAPVSVARMPFVLLVILLVVIGVLGILVIQTRINENQFRLSGLRDKQTNLDRQQAQLEQGIADAESPNSLAAAARRLGLVPAGTPAFIRLPDGRILGIPKPATGTPSVTTGDQPAAAPPVPLTGADLAPSTGE